MGKKNETVFLPSSSKKEILSELTRELNMRLEVWPMISKKKRIFKKDKHQQQYNVMRDLYYYMKQVTDKEFYSTMKRIAEKEKAVQTNLFDK